MSRGTYFQLERAALALAVLEAMQGRRIQEAAKIKALIIDRKGRQQHFSTWKMKTLPVNTPGL